MQRQHRARDDLRSRRLPGALIGVWIAFATALAFAAPLVHAHFDAQGAVSQGLCGEHAPAAPDAPGGEGCPVCLAGGHAPAAPLRSVAVLVAPVRWAAAGPAGPHRADCAPRRGPCAPRAPPRSA